MASFRLFVAICKRIRLKTSFLYAQFSPRVFSSTKFRIQRALCEAINFSNHSRGWLLMIASPTTTHDIKATWSIRYWMFLDFFPPPRHTTGLNRRDRFILLYAQSFKVGRISHLIKLFLLSRLYLFTFNEKSQMKREDALPCCAVCRLSFFHKKMDNPPCQ